MLKWFMLFVLFLVSCGDISPSIGCTINGKACRRDEAVHTVAKDGSSCSVSETDSLVRISCTDGTESTFDKPKDGKPGAKGEKGDTGHPDLTDTRLCL
jgi:hypothetical protein